MFSEKYGYMPEKVIQCEKVSDELLALYGYTSDENYPL